VIPLPVPPLLLITDRRQTGGRPVEHVVAMAFAGGCRWVSLREKDMWPPHRLALLSRLMELAAPCGASVSVHDDIEAAAATGAGLHLPAVGDPAAARRRLGPAARIGISTHDAEGLRHAAAAGADYATLGPFFATSSKPGYAPRLTPSEMAELAACAVLPVLALGGIDCDKVAAVRACGVAGIAAMGGIMRAPDPAAAVRRLTGR